MNATTGTARLLADLRGIAETDLRALLDALDAPGETSLFRALAYASPGRPGLTEAVLAAESTRANRVVMLDLLDRAADAIDQTARLDRGDIHVGCCEDDCRCADLRWFGPPPLCDRCDENVRDAEQDAVGAALTFLRGLL